jgi:hypothetical protein
MCITTIKYEVKMQEKSAQLSSQFACHSRQRRSFHLPSGVPSIYPHAGTCHLCNNFVNTMSVQSS